MEGGGWHHKVRNLWHAVRVIELVLRIYENLWGISSCFTRKPSEYYTTGKTLIWRCATWVASFTSAMRLPLILCHEKWCIFLPIQCIFCSLFLLRRKLQCALCTHVWQICDKGNIWTAFGLHVPQIPGEIIHLFRVCLAFATDLSHMFPMEY